MDVVLVISAAEIHDKAARLYGSAIMAWITGQEETFFPYRIPANLTLPKDQATLIRQVDGLREGSKQTRGFGYTITWQERRSRKHGTNLFPSAIWLDSLDDLAKLLGKRTELRKLSIAIDKLRTAQAGLETWLCEPGHWKELLAAGSHLDDLLLVLKYFQKNPRPDCFVRELPLALSTKLVEQHQKLLGIWLDRTLPPQMVDVRYSPRQFAPRYGLRYVRPHFLLRILDDSLQTELGFPVDELSLPVHSLARLPVFDAVTFIVENKVNLLTLPAYPRGLALGGLGNAVVQLGELGWIDRNPLYYWGDLDFEGFEILGRLRHRFPDIKSINMDQETWSAHRDLSISGNRVDRPIPNGLTLEEEKLCHYLQQCNGRLEQERIPQSWVKKSMQSLA